MGGLRSSSFPGTSYRLGLRSPGLSVLPSSLASTPVQTSRSLHPSRFPGLDPSVLTLHSSDPSSVRLRIENHGGIERSGLVDHTVLTGGKGEKDGTVGRVPGTEGAQ